MFLKRTLVLAAGVLLFLIGFIVYFEVLDAQMEDRFRQERKASGSDGQLLTTQIASSPVPVPASPASPVPAPAAGTSSAEPSASTSDTATSSGPAPAPAENDTNLAPMAPSATPELPDTNVIIGPMPPPSPPDNTSAPSTPTPPDTNSATPTPPATNSGSPTPPPSSTLLYPGVKNLALCMLAGYTLPIGGAQSQMTPSSPLTVTLPAPAPSPATNTPDTTAPAASTPDATTPAVQTPAASVTTNEAPADAAAAPVHPLPVEASVIVLLYHQFVPPGAHISPKFQWTMNQDVFATEMKYIHDNGYHVIPMSDLLKFLRHEIGLPPKSVVITIDDGYKSALVYAAPILKQYDYPWTFFVYPDFITPTESKGAASWPDLLALQAEGIDIECHSMTHPNLTSHHQKIKGVWHNLSPEEYDQWLTNETAGAKALLEQKLGHPITCFAYPYGNYNKQVEAKTIAAGFQAIFTVADNPVRSTTSMYSIGRYTITQAVIKDFYAYLRQGALGLADIDPAPGTTITNPRPIITAVLSYAGTIDPTSLETSVRDFGLVRHDFDPKTSTLRLYLPRDLVQPVNLVNIRAKDAQTGQVMVANWHFNYQPPVTAPIHAPIGIPAPAPNGATNAPINGTSVSAPVPSASAVSASSPSLSNVTAAPTPRQTDPPPAATAVH